MNETYIYLTVILYHNQTKRAFPTNTPYQPLSLYTSHRHHTTTARSILIAHCPVQSNTVRYHSPSLYESESLSAASSACSISKRSAPAFSLSAAVTASATFFFSAANSLADLKILSSPNTLFQYSL